MLQSMGSKRVRPDWVIEQGDKEPGHVRSGPHMGHPERLGGQKGM